MTKLTSIKPVAKRALLVFLFPLFFLISFGEANANPVFNSIMHSFRKLLYGGAVGVSEPLPPLVSFPPSKEFREKEHALFANLLRVANKLYVDCLEKKNLGASAGLCERRDFDELSRRLVLDSLQFFIIQQLSGAFMFILDTDLPAKYMVNALPSRTALGTYNSFPLDPWKAGIVKSSFRKAGDVLAGSKQSWEAIQKALEAEVDGFTWTGNNYQEQSDKIGKIYLIALQKHLELAGNEEYIQQIRDILLDHYKSAGLQVPPSRLMDGSGVDVSGVDVSGVDVSGVDVGPESTPPISEETIEKTIRLLDNLFDPTLNSLSSESSRVIE